MKRVVYSIEIKWEMFYLNNDFNIFDNIAENIVENYNQNNNNVRIQLK